MKRFFFAAIAALALLVPTLAFAQVKTVYIPGAHPRVVVVQPESETAPAKSQKMTLKPTEVIAIHTPMAAAQRANTRVNYSAVAHCDNFIAAARAELSRNN
jgi:hypothetical protein